MGLSSVWVTKARMRRCVAGLVAVFVAAGLAVATAPALAGAGAAALAGAGAAAASDTEPARAEIARVNDALTRLIGRIQGGLHKPAAHVDAGGLLRSLTAVKADELGIVQPFPAVLGRPYGRTFTPLQCIGGHLAAASAELRLGNLLRNASALVRDHVRSAFACAQSLARELHSGPRSRLHALVGGLKALARRGTTRAQLARVAALVRPAAAQLPSVFGQPYGKTFAPLDCLATQLAEGADMLSQLRARRLRAPTSFPLSFLLARLRTARACTATLDAVLRPAAAGGVTSPVSSPSTPASSAPQPGLGTTGEQPIYLDQHYSFAERAADLVSRMTLAEKVAQLRTNSAPAIPRLGVQQYTYWSEGQHGINALGADTNRGSAGSGPNATSFPTNFAAAMSWDPKLMYDETTAISDEARGFLDKSLWNAGQNNLGPSPSDYGSLTFWAPTVNLDRDPRWGRTDEAFGEDPYLVSRMAGAFVDGYQGQSPAGQPLTPYLKVAATAKHFALNDVEQHREAISSDVNDTDLHDYYTAQFKSLIEDAHVSGLMTSLNAINGTPAMVDAYTTRQVAERTYGFDGYTTTDCALANVYRISPNGHNWAPPGWTTDGQDVNATWTNGATGATVSGAAGAQAYALRSGTDLNCTGSQATTGNVQQAIDAGMLSEGVIDAALTRLFTTRMMTGEFDPPAQVPYTSITKSAIQSPAHQALAEQVAANSVVLLKNDDVAGTSAPLLPVSAGAVNKVVILGDLANKVVLGGYSGVPALKVSAVQGITAAVRAANPSASVVYDSAGTSTTSTSAAVLSAQTQSDIRTADLVVVVAGTDAAVAGEGHDRSTIGMPGNYQSLIDQAAAVGNPRMVLAIQSDGPVALAAAQADFPAIVFSGYNGESQGTALADVLFGKQNPSGHLDFTWYADDSQLPAMSNYGLTPSATGGLGRTYMYFTGAPMYPFGYGLSYTRFAFSNLQVTPQATVPADGTVNVSFDVTNTGAVPGATVAQLYVASPSVTGVERPSKRLEGFQKTDVLQPGQTQAVSTTVAVRDLAFWNQSSAKSQVDDGSYRFELGADASHIAVSQSLTVTGALTPHVKYVTVQPPAVVYKPGDTVDLATRNPWLADDTSPATEQRNQSVTADGIVEAVNDDGSFVDLSKVPVTYGTSNPNVVTVSGSGMMSAVAPGVATLHATVGGVTGSAVVVVKQPLTLSAPAVALPGSAFTLTETLLNTGSTPLSNVNLSLAAPAGWTAAPGSATSDSTIPAGGSAQVTWTVTPPASAAPGSYDLQASATPGGQSTVTTLARVAVPYRSLSAAFDNVGVSDDASPATGNLDGGGRSYSAQALAAAGLTAGATVTHDGLSFVWPAAAPGSPGNVTARGQAIPVTGAGQSLGFLGTGDYGMAEGAGTIVYSDGSLQRFDLVFADWWASSAARGGDIAATTAYVNTPSGRRQQQSHIDYASVPLTAGKTARYVILPDVSGAPAVNQTAMHIFSIGIG